MSSSPADIQKIDNATVALVIDYLQNQYDSVPNTFTYQATIGGVTLSILVFSRKVYVFFEGTHDMPDVKADFEAEMIFPPELKGAGVHAGFWEGLTEAFAVILTYLPKYIPIYLCGHSLGAGRVNPAAGLLLYYGYDAANLIRIKFGSPNSNDMILEVALRDSPYISVWNYGDILFHDPIGSVPIHCAIKGYGWPYFTGEKRTLIKWPPELLDKWGAIMGWHHLTPNYKKGWEKLCQN